MIKNEYTLNVDLKKKMSTVVPTFVQYDSATLLFKLFDDGSRFDLTGYTEAKVFHLRKDGSVIEGQATIREDGDSHVIEYNYSGNEMKHVGDVHTSLSVYSEDKKVSIQTFIVKVVQDLADAYAQPSNPEAGALQTLTAKVERLDADVRKTLAESKIQEQHAKAQGDYAKAQGDHAKTQGNLAQDIINSNKNVLLSPVANFAAITTTYPNPPFGGKVQTTNDGRIYRWNNTEWKYVEHMDSNILTDVQVRLDLGVVEIKSSQPTGLAKLWIDTSTK